jgi:hypothetical protein
MSIERPNEAALTGDFEFVALNEAHHYRAALVQEFSYHLQGNVLEIGAVIDRSQHPSRVCRRFESSFRWSPTPS